MPDERENIFVSTAEQACATSSLSLSTRHRRRNSLSSLACIEYPKQSSFSNNSSLDDTCSRDTNLIVHDILNACCPACSLRYSVNDTHSVLYHRQVCKSMCVLAKAHTTPIPRSPLIDNDETSKRLLLSPRNIQKALVNNIIVYTPRKMVSKYHNATHTRLLIDATLASVDRIPVALIAHALFSLHSRLDERRLLCALPAMQRHHLELFFVARLQNVQLHISHEDRVLFIEHESYKFSIVDAYKGALNFVEEAYDEDETRLKQVNSVVDAFACRRLDAKSLHSVYWCAKTLRMLRLEHDSQQFSFFPNKLCTFFTNLTHLVLRNHLFTDVPDSIVMMRALRVLVLCHNALTRLPHSLYRLEQLDILYASNNNIDTVPRSYEKFSHLVSLNLRNNLIKHLDYNTLRGWHALESLDMSGNPYKDDVPTYTLSKLSALRHVSLGSYKMLDGVVQAF